MSFITPKYDGPDDDRQLPDGELAFDSSQRGIDPAAPRATTEPPKLPEKQPARSLGLGDFAILAGAGALLAAGMLKGLEALRHLREGKEGPAKPAAKAPEHPVQRNQSGQSR